MARHSALLLALLLAAALVPAVLARKPSHRRLNYNAPSGSSPVTPSSPPYSPPPSSGSSPVTPSIPPYSSSPPSSGSSPVTPSTPYTPPSSGSSPVTPSTPPYSTPPSSGSSPVTPSSPPYSTPPSSGSSPVTPSTPPPSTPSPPSPTPEIVPPVTSSPSGRYGGYGSRSGKGTSGFWRRNSGRVPKILSLLSTIVKLFGGRAGKSFSGKKTLLGALQDTSTDPMSSLAREGSASLINTYAVSGFPLTTDDVLTLFNNALSSDDQAAQQATSFQQMNEAV